MNTREIEVLLEKYYEGDTTLTEEKLLREFFTGKDLPAHLKSHQPMFAFFAGEQFQEPEDAGFVNKMDALLAGPSVESKVIPMHQGRRRLLFITGIAASVLLLAGLFYTFQQDFFNTGKSRNNAYKTGLAYAEASEALLIISSNLNSGLKQASRLQMVDKAMKNVQLFNRFYQYEIIIINPDLIQKRSDKSK